MFQRIRKHLTPSTFIAFIALVFALTGGAFAASSHGGGAGKATASTTTTVANVAKAKPKPKTKAGPRGPAGPKGATGAAGAAGATGATGPGGPAGPAGPTGPAGTAGSNGVNGTNGESVTNTKASKTACPEGGTEFKVGAGTATKACTGEKGAIHPNETLPAGSSETGTWTVTIPPIEGESVFVPSPISFTIPLAAALSTEKIFIIGKVGDGASGKPYKVEECNAKTEPAEKVACEAELKKEEEACPGSTGESQAPASDPKAAAGFLCVYALDNEAGLRPGGVLSTTPVGVVLGVGALKGTEGKSSFGTWAVTAPEA